VAQQQLQLKLRHFRNKHGAPSQVDDFPLPNRDWAAGDVTR
jgi:hypothetical protein